MVADDVEAGLAEAEGCSEEGGGGVEMTFLSMAIFFELEESKRIRAAVYL